jgi:diaminopimelate epimerase
MKFVKISATGNDFILIDNRAQQLSGEENEFFRKICQRKQGVGADGVILRRQVIKLTFIYEAELKNFDLFKTKS